MTRVAIIEDEDSEANLLMKHIHRYEEEKNCPLEVTRFASGLEFLENYRSDYDILFIDIQMPHLNGMETARRIFEKDKTAILIFVTSLRQYALQGYEVNALDYMLKPVSYESISDKLEKALTRLKKRPAAKTLLLKENTVIRLDIDDIYYIEVIGHTLFYHTLHGSYNLRGRLSDVEDELATHGFSRCNKGLLINLRHVKSIEKNSVFVGQEKLPVSRGRQKQFLEDYLSYLKKGGI